MPTAFTGERPDSDLARQLLGLSPMLTMLLAALLLTAWPWDEADEGPHFLRRPTSYAPNMRAARSTSSKPRVYLAQDRSSSSMIRLVT